MLETKRVTAYGKRSTRIVYVSDEPRAHHGSPFTARHLSRGNTTSNSPLSARKTLGFAPRKVHGLSTSPRGSPKSGNVLGIASKRLATDSTPKRQPFGVKAPNVPGSPSVAYLNRKSMQTPNGKPSNFAPFVDSDVVLIEHPGHVDAQRTKKSVNKPRKASSQLRKMESATEEEPEVVRPPRKRAPKRAIVVTDDEDDVVDPTPRRKDHGLRAHPIIVSSDESSDDFPEIVAVKSPPKARALRPNGTQQNLGSERLRVPSRRAQVEVTVPTLQQPSQPKPKPTRAAPQPLAPPKTVSPVVPVQPPSPRRSQRNAAHPPNSSHAETLTTELELSFAALTVSTEEYPPGSSSKRTPQHLVPLLAECKQTEPHCFTTFIATFPFDDIHGQNPPADLAFRKIGEASYSEVFAIGNVVLKIVPLRDESPTVLKHDGGLARVDSDLDLPQESEARDVRQEMVVTRAMGQICPGFIKLLRTYVVLGAYPPLLLSLWDESNGCKASENIRPDIFPPTQAYAVLVLPNGGPDLEAFTFPVKTGWRQACSIFWQTVKALATAEELVSFEHRDLHWGQILVKGATPMCKVVPRTRRAVAITDEVECTPMDHPSHGVTATIIDLGLARMDAGDGNGSGVHWTPFDDLIFQGEGDYQFDVYRLMRRHHGDTWQEYLPLTNIMWLHYLTRKLLHSKRLRPPGKRYVNAVLGGFGEKECHECLVEMEHLLGACFTPSKGKKWRAGVKGTFSKAGDVVLFARDRGWLE